MRKKPGDSVRVCSVSDQAEADLLCSILDERQVPYLLKTMKDAAYDGIYVAQGPYGFVEAPEDRADAILQILKDLRETRKR